MLIRFTAFLTSCLLSGSSVTLRLAMPRDALSTAKDQLVLLERGNDQVL